MESDLKRNGMRVLKIISEQTVEQNTDIQINLPEYCSDIKKILKCFVIPNVFASGISGDRATADGEATVRVIYVGDTGKLECYEQSVPFSKYVEIPNAESDMCVKVSTKTEYVNCRAVSRRRISVSSGIGIKFLVKRTENEMLFSACDEDKIEAKSENIKCTVPTAVCEKIFDMSETAAISDNLAPVSSVINASTYASIDTVKTVSDKMLIKGEMVTQILYSCDSESAATENFTHTMPISQIIDIEGIDENSLCNVEADIMSLCVSPKSDSDGNKRLLDISVKGLFSVSAYENCEVCAVSDGYSVEYETETEYKNISFKEHIFTYKETKQIKSSVQLQGAELSEIIGAFVLKCDGSAENKDGKILGNGEIPIGLLYKNTDGEYGYTEKTVDFSFECRSEDTDENIIVEPHFTVTETSTGILSSDSAEIKMSVFVSMPIFKEKEKLVCTKLQTCEDRKKAVCECPLTVCFPSPGEKIWDIAKKYNTTCTRIKEDNDISGDEVTDKTMLLISSV